MNAKPKVVASKPLPQQAIDLLREHCDLYVYDGDSPMPRERLLEELADAEGLITSGDRIDDELLGRAPKLRAVSTVSVGYDHFDLSAMRNRGVVGTHTPYVLDDTVADLVLALMLAAARRVPELDAYVKSGQWHRDEGKAGSALFGMDVHHAKLGLIGLGRIGESIARRAALGFDMKVYYYNRSRRPEAEEKYGAQYVPLEELLRECDFVVLMLPLTPKTERFFGRAQFELMKPSAFFINASRGKVVDEAALVEALRNGTIRGAGLDVFETEPVPPDHPLLALPNVVALPHIGSATAKTRFDMAMTAARNLVEALRGGDDAYIVKELKPQT